MTSLVRTVRDHRESARSRRALLKALDSASTSSVRDDLVLAIQRSNSTD